MSEFLEISVPRNYLEQAVWEAATICLRHLQVDLCPLDLGVQVVCDVGYLCANFGLPRPLCSQLRPDVRDRQTEVVIRQTCIIA